MKIAIEKKRKQWNEASKRYIARHPERYVAAKKKKVDNYAKSEKRRIKVAEWSRFAKYGVSPTQWKEMSKNGCEICNGFNRLCVDHDHETGKVRGCLCHSCNASIGHFKNSPVLLKKAAKYLERSRL